MSTRIEIQSRIQGSYETVATALFVTDCASCGVVFAIPSTLEERRREDHGSFYCPNGHSMVFKAESEADKLRKQLEATRERVRGAYEFADTVQDTLRAERRSHAATKGKLTKTKNRVAAGVCPCCNRSFVQLQRHMESQHPDYTAP